MSIGDKIKSARQDSGYTQDQLADAIGVTRNTISRWEHDKTVLSPEDLIELVKIDDLTLNVAIKKSVKHCIYYSLLLKMSYIGHLICHLK